MTLLQKKATTTTIAFFWWFYYKEGDSSNVVTFFYGSGAMKKIMAASCHSLLSFSFFLLFWSFWYSSLELRINNEMVGFFYVESCNG
jgi:hypothetical protein